MSVLRSRQLAIALALAATASIGCATSPVEPEPAAPTVEPQLSLLGDLIGVTTTTLKKTTNLVFGLLTCSPLRPDEGSKYIGPNGGTLKVGEYTLVVPSGALDRTVRITMQQVRDTVNSVRFGPEGLQFQKSAKLTMTYDNCRSIPGNRDHKVVYVDERLRVLETPASRDNARNEEVTADIDHFSRYAVAW